MPMKGAVISRQTAPAGKASARGTGGQAKNPANRYAMPLIPTAERPKFGPDRSLAHLQFPLRGV